MYQFGRLLRIRLSLGSAFGIRIRIVTQLAYAAARTTNLLHVPPETNLGSEKSNYIRIIATPRGPIRGASRAACWRVGRVTHFSGAIASAHFMERGISRSAATSYTWCVYVKIDVPAVIGMARVMPTTRHYICISATTYESAIFRYRLRGSINLGVRLYLVPTPLK